MKNLLIFAILLISSFLITAFGIWIITLLLSLVGINITFTWRGAFAVWVIWGIIGNFLIKIGGSKI